MSSSAATGGFHPGHQDGAPGAVSALVQPHGVVLVVREPLLRIVQLSTSAALLLQRSLDTLLLCTLRELGGDLHQHVQALARSTDTGSRDFTCTLGPGPTARPAWQARGLLYRVDEDTLLIELEALSAVHAADAGQRPTSELLLMLGHAVQRVSEAATLDALLDGAAQSALLLSGYDRVAICATTTGGPSRPRVELHAPGVPGLSGDQPWPAPPLDAPWPPAAQTLLAGSSRLHAQIDTAREPAELVPCLPHARDAVIHGALDLSQGRLGSLQPAQLQRLRAAGVAARALLPLLHDGAPWGWIVFDHRQPRRLPERTRAALELLAEAVGTRIAAIEHHARARAAEQLRGLEQRLVEATSDEGDWRQALVREPERLLQPLRADGAVLLHGGEMVACGSVPAAPELRLLVKWLAAQDERPLLICDDLQTRHATLAALAPAATRVLAVSLSATESDALIWLRGPGQEAWSGIDQATAAGFGRALAEISVQVHAVRLLIAHNQMAQLRQAVAGSRQAVVVASVSPPACQANDAFDALAGRSRSNDALTLDDFMALFTDADLAHRVIGQVRAEQRPWRGTLALRRPGLGPLPVAVRAEPVPARDGSLLGFIVMLEDHSASHQADSARQRLEALLSRTERGLRDAGHADLVGAILVNAGIAAMDISDDGPAESTAALLAAVEASTERAAALFKRIRDA